jgi:hypothetical protein
MTKDIIKYSFKTLVTFKIKNEQDSISDWWKQGSWKKHGAAARRKRK